MKRVMFMLLSCALSPSSTGDSRSNHTAADNKHVITTDRQAAIVAFTMSAIALVIGLIICEPYIFTRTCPPEV